MRVMNKKLVFFLLTILTFHASNVAADKAILAGGCFWCMEADFEKLEGVTDVVSGFTGGALKNPTYNGNQARQNSCCQGVRRKPNTH